MNLPEQQKIKSVLIRGLAVIGFFSILFGGLWGTVQVVKSIPQILSTIAAVSTSITSIFIANEDTVSTSSETEPIDVSKNETRNETRNTERVAGEREDNVFPVTSITVSNPQGEPDLAVTILATGIIDEQNNFLPTDSISRTKRGAVTFEIRNIGTKESGSWTFNAVLPTFPMQIFHSKAQKSLLPGDRIEFTLGFDQITNLPDGVITINADPTGSIKEISEENNIRQKTITITE